MTTQKRTILGHTIVVEVWPESKNNPKYGAQVNCPHDCESVYNTAHRKTENAAVNQVISALKYHLQLRH